MLGLASGFSAISASSAVGFDSHGRDAHAPRAVRFAEAQRTLHSFDSHRRDAHAPRLVRFAEPQRTLRLLAQRAGDGHFVQTDRGAVEGFLGLVERIGIDGVRVALARLHQ